MKPKLGWSVSLLGEGGPCHGALGHGEKNYYLMAICPGHLGLDRMASEQICEDGSEDCAKSVVWDKVLADQVFGGMDPGV